MRKALLAIHFLLCAVVPLSAEEEKEDPRKASGRTAWFIYTALPEGVENPIKVMSGKDIIEVTLSKRSVSQPVKIPGDGILRVVREEADPKDATQVVYRILAQAQVAEGVGKALIILMPLPKPQGDLVFNAKVQDLAGFKGGDWLFMNLTNADIGIQLGASKLTIKPAGLHIHNTPGLTQPTSTPISYHYRIPGKKEWELISASTIAMMPTRREICLFSADPRFGRIDYHGITFPVE
jgi:hypothetical protein